jgi:hypothetical protein
VFVTQHLLGLEAFEQAPAHKGAQDATAQAGLGLGRHFAGDAGGRVKTVFCGVCSNVQSSKPDPLPDRAL